MFNAKLYDFQTAHEENLLHKCAAHEEMILCAPTGSGKTVLVCKFIDDYLDENMTIGWNWGMTHTLSYAFDIKENHFDVLVGTEYS